MFCSLLFCAGNLESVSFLVFWNSKMCNLTCSFFNVFPTDGVCCLKRRLGKTPHDKLIDKVFSDGHRRSMLEEECDVVVRRIASGCLNEGRSFNVRIDNLKWRSWKQRQKQAMLAITSQATSFLVCSTQAASDTKSGLLDSRRAKANGFVQVTQAILACIESSNDW